MRTARPFLALLTVIAAVAPLGAWSARAQGSGSPAAGSATTTTTSPGGAQLLVPGQGERGGPPPTTTTTAPDNGSNRPASQPPAPAETAAEGSPPPAGASTAVPPEYQRLIASVHRSAPNDTGALVAALAQLEQFGMTGEQAAIVGMGRFPVAGYATFTDDWWNPRFTPSFHLHMGTDVFAARSTPVRAPIDGVYRSGEEPVGGLAAYVTMPDGTYFYMAHLDALVAGLASGQQVHTGQIVGFVGNTGDAAGGPTHVHLEIHPRGGAPVNPKPYLDRFVADALARVPALVAFYRSRAGGPEPTPPVPALAGVDDAAEMARMFTGPAGPPAGTLLWAASMNPSGGPLRLAEAQVAAAAGSIDWESYARRDDARRAARLQAAAAARALLDPLTPRALRLVLS